MRRVCLMVVAGLFCGATVHADLSSNERERVSKAAQVVAALRNAPDKGIPEELWARAHCVLVMPEVKKAAFVFGGEFGRGVMSCRQGQAWSAPVFMELMKGSWGLQIGAQATDLVLLVMNREGVSKMLEDKVTLGVDASVAAGPVGRTGSAATEHTLTAQVLSYSRSRGLFAGIDLSGGVLRPDKDANEHAYGVSVKARQVVEEGRTPPQVMTTFVTALN
jgi:SH3 domain-containing YSC84-like protein 1